MQKGSAQIVVISAVALIIFGALGFLFWNNFLQTKEQSKDENSTNPSASVSTPPLPAADADVSDEEDIIYIKEWGIKLKSSVKNDLVYSITSRVGGPEKTEIDSLGLKIKAESVNDQSCIDFGADLYRQKVPTQFQSKKIGEYYYYVTGAPGRCSENAEDLKLQDTVLTELIVSNISES